MRALRKKIIVFSVPIRRRLKSGIYLANSRKSQYFGGEDVWIASVGDGCLESVRVGQKAIVSDAMELEPTDLGLWLDLRHLPEFKELLDYVAEVDGEVRTQIVTEDSLLAVYE